MVYIKVVEKPPDFSRIEVMESQKLPFEITPQIKRYLEDILFLHRECFPESITSLQPDKVFFLVEKEITGEIKTPRQYVIQRIFWQYLREQKIIKPVFVLLARSIQNLMVEAEPFFRNSKGEIYTGLRPSVIAVGRTREEPDKSIKRFSACYKNLQQVLERLQKHARHKHVVFKLSDIKPIGELLERIKSGESEIQQVQDKNKDIQPITLLEGTKWQNITIRFIDNNDNVEISNKGEIIRTVNYKQMGFEDAKRKRPNFQWDLLQLLTIQKGKLSWDTNLSMSKKERDKLKQRVKGLKNTLKDYFQMSESPFYGYRKEGNVYRIKINLIPAFTDRSESEIVRTHEDEGGVSKEVKEYLDETAPSVLEEPREHEDDY